jgi:hypothetical protein
MLAWENFYVIVGSTAGALIGLQFVAMALIANTSMARSGGDTGAAYGTPTIVHFSKVLFLAAVMSAPWSGPRGPILLWGIVGFVGLVYEIVIARRLLRYRHVYEPVFEDWLCHVVLPALAYGTLMWASYISHSWLSAAFFGVGAAALMLLFVGVHNAWDTVIYLVFVRAADRKPDAGSLS